MTEEPRPAVDEVEAWLASTSTNPISGEGGFYVPPDADWCPRCGDTNLDDVTRLCITCTDGCDSYRDGKFANGWSAR